MRTRLSVSRMINLEDYGGTTTGAINHFMNNPLDALIGADWDFCGEKECEDFVDIPYSSMLRSLRMTENNLERCRDKYMRAVAVCMKIVATEDDPMWDNIKGCGDIRAMARSAIEGNR